MSLAFSHNATVSTLRSTNGKTRRETFFDLAFIVPFVVLATLSILFILAQPSMPQAEQAMTAFAQF